MMSSVVLFQLPSHALCPVPEWSSQQVAKWLCTHDLSTYAPLFTQRQVDGRELLALDNTKLKVSYVAMLFISRFAIGLIPSVFFKIFYFVSNVNSSYGDSIIF